MTIFNGPLGRATVTPRPVPLDPVIVATTYINPVPSYGYVWPITAGVGGGVAKAPAGSVAFAIFGGDAIVTAFSDTAGTAWELVGAYGSYTAGVLYRCIVPAGGWNSQTVFNATLNWSSPYGTAATIIVFPLCKTLPRTNDFMSNSITSGPTYDKSIGGTVKADSMQIAIVWAYAGNFVSGPNSGSTGGWSMLQSVNNVPGASGKICYAIFWHRAVDNDPKTLKANGDYCNYYWGWAEAGF